MIELIFLHLPKTGGSSILKMLNYVYGTEQVKHFERDECLMLNANSQKISEVIDANVKVLHGHIKFQEIKDIVKRDRPKLVTFLREPTARVISNYHWWQHTLRENPNHAAVDRLNEPIEEYVKNKETRNKMSNFLKGSSLGNYYFIGFLENFETDMTALSKKLDWPEVPVFHEKNSKNFKVLTERRKENLEQIKAISRFNKKDKSLYDRALRLCNKL